MISFKKVAISIIFIFALSYILRRYFVETYSVLSISMNNTLLEGDKILLYKTNKISYGDIVVFESDGKYYIKRCIALPNDTVRIINGGVFINNHTEKSFSKYVLNNYLENDLGYNPIILRYYGFIWSAENFGPMVIPSVNKKVLLTSYNFSLYKNIIAKETNDNLEIIKKLYLNKVYTFKNHYYFMLGDNRPKSTDSRMYGPIPQTSIVGKVYYILYSKYNFKRIFQKVE